MDLIQTLLFLASSVTSSIRSIASSLGFKRGSGTSSTVSSSSSLPSASSTFIDSESAEPVKKMLDEPVSAMNIVSDLGEVYEPLPGQSLRAGIPAPPNARLSMGLSAKAGSPPTTTIRLISRPEIKQVPQTPQLKPFKTTFDLELRSPHGCGFGGTTLWPAEERSMYPALPFDSPSRTPMPSIATMAKTMTKEATTMPGGFEDLPNPHPSPAEGESSPKLPNPHSQPTTPTRTPSKSSPSSALSIAKPAFIFGSPLPEHNVTNDQFRSAAASVLEEMNKRLQADGVNSVETGILSRIQQGAHLNGVVSMSSRGTSSVSSRATSGVKEKFDKQHEAEFSKMEGIDAVLKRKASTTSHRSSASVGYGAGRDRFGRRTGSSVGRVSASRTVSTSTKHSRTIPGAFDDDDDEEEVDGMSATIVAQNTGATAQSTEELDQGKRQKEREVIRRKLDMNKARRRSSAATTRVSIGRGGVPSKSCLIPARGYTKTRIDKPQAQTPAKPKFGFLSSAKSLVKSVWDKGKKLTNTPKANKISPAPTKFMPQRKASTATASTSTTATRPPSRPSSATNAIPPAVRASVGDRAQAMKAGSMMSSSTLVFSTKSFAPTRNNTVKATETRESSVQPQEDNPPVEPATPLAATAAASSRPNIPSSIRSNSSVGSVNTIARNPSTRTVSTLSARTSGGSVSSIRPRARIASVSSTTSSRLLAPTASSLAKAAGTRRSIPTSSVTSPRNGTLAAITNTDGYGITSPRLGSGIFSKPLAGPTLAAPRIQPRIASVSQQWTLSRNTSIASKASTDSKRSVTRKPRISRSKVIAKLASQRAAGSDTSKAASTSGSGATATGRPRIPGTPRIPKTGKTRSSLGAQAKRSSFAGVAGKKHSVADAVLQSAKKRVRQSEYYRRASSKPVKGLDLRKAADIHGDEMLVDEDD